MTVRVYVPRDAAALALGADAVASLLSQAGEVELVRTGSRGLFWLEPMVEVVTSEGVSPTVRSRSRIFPVCSVPACWSGVRIRCAWGGRRSCRISRNRRG